MILLFITNKIHLQSNKVTVFLIMAGEALRFKKVSREGLKESVPSGWYVIGHGDITRGTTLWEDPARAV